MDRILQITITLSVSINYQGKRDRTLEDKNTLLFVPKLLSDIG